jgi:hypothetical protein
MKKQSILSLSFVVAFLLLTIVSCSKSSNSSTPKPTVIGNTLYDSLGGTTLVADPTHAGAMIEKGRLGIRNVIDSTIFVIAADPKINGHFTVLLSEVTQGNL